MTKRDIEHTAKTPLRNLTFTAGFEASLAKLTAFIRAFARSLEQSITLLEADGNPVNLN